MANDLPPADPGTPAPPANPPNPPSNPAPPAPPPAATTVLTGTKTEREITLEAELQTERGSHAKTAEEKKEREVRINELEDELRRLKTVPSDKKSRLAILDMSEFFED